MSITDGFDGEYVPARDLTVGDQIVVDFDLDGSETTCRITEVSKGMIHGCVHIAFQPPVESAFDPSFSEVGLNGLVFRTH